MISFFKKISLFLPFIFSCSHAQMAVPTKLKDMSCDQLITATKNKEFALNSLAGVRGIKKCPTFNFDLKSISDLERRIYADEIAEANNFMLATAPVSTTAQIVASETLSIDELRVQIRKEKKPVEKMALMKQLRAKYRANNQRGDAAKVLKDFHSLALKTYKKEPKNTTHQELYLEASVNFGRHLYANNELLKADQLLTAATKSLKNKQNLIEIYFLLVKVKEDSERYQEVAALYDRILEDLKIMPSKNPLITREKVLWSKAWVFYKDEDFQKSSEAFKVLALETADAAEKARAQFFLARSLVWLDKKEEAKKIWLAMTQEDFYSYYSLLAYEQLGQKIPAFNSLKATDKFNFDKTMSFLSLRQKELFKALLQHEEVDLAERAVQIFTNKPDQMTIMGLELAQRGKRFLPLFMGFAKLPVEQKQDILVKNYDLLFPRLWEAEVKEMATLTGLPTSLIFSIMRQESAFNINSRSPANAFGLMQVIPPLAKSLARKHKVEYKSAEDLFNPQINIKIGSFELSEQVKRQKDQYALVAAAYNAGPGAVSRWLKQRFRPKFDMVDFIEEIPYDETRLYVKIIARNHLFYDRIESPNQETNFPEKFIKSSNVLSKN